VFFTNKATPAYPGLLYWCGWRDSRTPGACRRGSKSLDYFL